MSLCICIEGTHSPKKAKQNIFFYIYQYMNACILQRRHNERNGVSNQQPHNCLLICVQQSVENSPVTAEFPAQRASNAENVSIWWRHHGKLCISNPAQSFPRLPCPWTRYIRGICNCWQTYLAWVIGNPRVSRLDSQRVRLVQRNTSKLQIE